MVYKAATSKRKKSKNGYERRDRILLELGHANYNDYLRSQDWYKIRKRVFSQFGKNCSLCQSKATEIHHRRYTKANLSGKTLKDLYPICHECHLNVEFSSSGKKRSLHQAIIEFDKILRNQKPAQHPSYHDRICTLEEEVRTLRERLDMIEGYRRSF